MCFMSIVGLLNILKGGHCLEGVQMNLVMSLPHFQVMLLKIWDHRFLSFVPWSAEETWADPVSSDICLSVMNFRDLGLSCKIWRFSFDNQIYHPLQ